MQQLAPLPHPPAIYFETGMHPTDDGKVTHDLDKVRNGDLDRHVWNGAIKGRMRDYNPLMIAIDSLWPVYPEAIGQDGDVDHALKAAVWYGLPGKPSQINGGNELFVVAGDNLYGEHDINSRERGLLEFGTVAGWAYDLCEPGQPPLQT